MKKLSIVLSMVLGLGILTSCGNNEVNDNIIENNVAVEDNVIQKEESPYNYKTEYVGDNTKVIGIVSNIEYGSNYKYAGIEIQSKEEPYGLKVNLKVKKDAEYPDFFDEAVMTFALIDNLSNLEYIDSETEEILEEFSREDCNVILRENGQKQISEIGNSIENFEDFEKSI